MEEASVDRWTTGSASDSKELKLQAMALASKALDIAMRAMAPDPRTDERADRVTRPYGREVWER
jgi:hypothetical protein